MSTITESVTRWFKSYGHLNSTHYYVTRTFPILLFTSHCRIVVCLDEIKMHTFFKIGVPVGNILLGRVSRG